MLACLDGDDAFLELLLARITDCNYANVDQAAMLLANMTKSDKLARLVGLKRALPAAGGAGADVSTSPYAMDQLMDCFVKGAEKGLNEEANYDFLSYVFADLSRLPADRAYFVTKRDCDGVIPISKLVVRGIYGKQGSGAAQGGGVYHQVCCFPREKGITNKTRNCCFDISSHQTFLSRDGVNLLPYLLLPLMGSKGYSDEVPPPRPLAVTPLTANVAGVGYGRNARGSTAGQEARSGLARPGQAPRIAATTDIDHGRPRLPAHGKGLSHRAGNPLARGRHGRGGGERSDCAGQFPFHNRMLEMDGWTNNGNIGVDG